MMNRSSTYSGWRTAVLAVAFWAATATSALGVDLALSPSDTLLERGQEFGLDVTVANVVELKSVNIQLSYDVDVLQIVGVDIGDGELFWCDDPDNAFGTAVSTSKPGRVLFGFSRKEGTKSTVEGGVLATVTLKVKANAAPTLSPGQVVVSLVDFYTDEQLPSRGTIFTDANDDMIELSQITTAPAQIRIGLDVPVVGYLEGIQEDIPSVAFDEDSSDYSIDLDDHVFDPFHQDAEIAWTHETNPSGVLDIVIDADHKVRISTVEENWNSEVGGTVSVVFTATCPSQASDTGQITVTVLPVNDPPQIEPIPSVQFNEDESASIDLDTYVVDVDNDPSEMEWVAQSGEPNILVTLEGHVARISATGDWSGSGTVTFTATDPGGLQASAEVIVTVDAVNDAPVVGAMPAFVFDEDGSASADLDDYVTDVDNIASEMRWTGVPSVADIQVDIDGDHVARVTASPDWSGEGTVTFTVMDPSDLSDESQVPVIVSAVNDAPVLGDIPDQSIDVGASFASISLDDYVADVDDPDDALTWTYEGNVLLEISITDRVASITPPADWSGSETITFTVMDPDGASDSGTATFAVTGGPAIDAAGFPEIRFKSHEQFCFGLDDYVADPSYPDDQLTWTAVPSTPDIIVEIDPVTHVVCITASPRWFGTGTITFTVTNPRGIWSSAVVGVVVERSDLVRPVIAPLPPMSFDEDGSDSSLLLDNFVEDDSPLAELSWTYESDEANLSVSIDPATRRVTFTATPDWNGAATVVFTVRDPDQLEDSEGMSVTVRPVNDPPVVGDIPDQSIDASESFVSISLDDYVTDVDDPDEALTWTYEGNVLLEISITGRVASITPPADRSVSEAITFTVTDPGGASDSDEATFTVTGGPVIDTGGFPVIRFKSHEQQCFDLDDYVADPSYPDDQLTWTAESSTADIIVEIDPVTHRVCVKATRGWSGTGTITFTVTNPRGIRSSVVVDVTVEPSELLPPAIASLPPVSFDEDGSDSSLLLDNFVEDDSPLAELSWTYESDQANLLVSIDPATRRVTFTATPDWNGSATVVFTVRDPDGLEDSEPLAVTVRPVNDAPVVGDIPDQSIARGASFGAIGLDAYVTDVDNTPDQIVWTFSGNVELQVAISADRVATVTAAAGWHGAETITFTATDPGGASASDPATFTVKSGPVINADDFPHIEFQSHERVCFGLDDYVDDPLYEDSQLTWTATPSDEHILVELDPVTHIVCITASPGWFGTGTITFTVTNPDGEGTSIVVDVVVTESGPVHPIVEFLPDKSFDEDGSDSSLILDGYATDDKPLDQLTWTYQTSNANVLVSIDPATRRVTFTATPNWNGAATVVFTATDADGLYDSDDMTVTVRPVNDPPGPFDLVGPENEAQLEYTQVKPTLSWTASADVDGDVVSYVLYYGTTEDFVGATQQAVSGLSFVPATELDRDIAYYWKVKALDGEGAEVWSNQTWTFTIEQVPIPPTFAIVALRHPMHELLGKHIINICVIPDQPLQGPPALTIDGKAQQLIAIDASKGIYYANYYATGPGTITARASGTDLDGVEGESTEQFTWEE